MAEATTNTERIALDLVLEALPNWAEVETWWDDGSWTLRVRVSIFGHSLTLALRGRDLYGPMIAPLRCLIWSAQAFCERALGAAERGPYW